MIGTTIYIFAQRKRINDLSSQIEDAQSQIAASPSPVESDPGSASTQQVDIVSILQNNNSQLLSVATQIAHLQQATSTNLEQAGFSVDEITLDIPGVNTSIQNGKLTITFAEGLFRFENVYNQFGWQTIRQLGYQLEAWVGKIRIDVIGFTDDQEKDDAYLGLERALMVVKTLDQNSQLPLGIFTIIDANNQPAPYPNDSLINRSRNRTVMFVVSPLLP
jgi:flagellar motor protein MotB